MPLFICKKMELHDIFRCWLIFLAFSMATVSVAGSVDVVSDAAGYGVPCLTEGEASDTVVIGSVLFPFSSSEYDPGFSGNSERLESIRSFLDSIPSAGVVSPRFMVTGSVSPEGSRAFNVRLAYDRAHTLCRVLGTLIGVSPEVTVEIPDRAPLESYPGLRSARILCAYVNAPPTGSYEDVVRGEDLSRKSSATCAASEGHDDTEAVEEKPSEDDHCCVAGEDEINEDDGPTTVVAGDSGFRLPPIAVSTNMLYDLACVPNIAVGVALSDRLTLWADWMSAWWSRKPDHFYYRVYGGDIDLRYRLMGGQPSNPFSGHHIGVYASMVCYDFQFGNHHTGVLSDKWNYAAGVSYMFSLPVGRKFSIDFSAGVGYMWGQFKKHIPIDDHDVWKSTHRRSWFGPTRLGVSLTYLLGPSTFNLSEKKGGGK